jgi:hypothetical protein
MASTRWPDVITALVTLMRATSGYRAPTVPGTGVPVYDGPQAAVEGAHTEPRSLIIGWRPQSDQAGESEQIVEVLAATTRPRTEDGAVWCTASAESGDSDGLATVRGQAFAILADVETLTRTNPDLSLGSASGFRWAHAPSQVAVTQLATSQGMACQLVFSITYKARIP